MIWERVEQPALNKKGGHRFQLSHAWDEAIGGLPHRLSCDQSEAQHSQVSCKFSSSIWLNYDFILYVSYIHELCIESIDAIHACAI